MGIRTLLVGLTVLILLAGCSPGGQPADSPTDSLTDSLTDSPTVSSPTQAPGPQPAVVASPAQPTATAMEQITEPTPALLECSGVLTSANQEGPYYSAGSPERTSLIEAGMEGTPIAISGYVFNQDCEPIAGARVDFWQADAAGEYDNAGYRLRGHVLSDMAGYYAIETIQPGIYPGRPPHIHVKVFAADGRELLTTQLYFPGSEESGDVRSAPDLLVKYLGSDATGRGQISFNFIVQD